VEAQQELKSIDKNILINTISFAILGGVGIFINTFLISTYNASILGRYNLAFSILLIASQFAVGGVQFSVLKYTSLYKKRKVIIEHIISSALLLTSILSLFVILILFLLGPFLANLISGKDFVFSIYLLLPALLFYSWNKVLLMGINGLQKMKTFAFFNALKYLILFLSVISFYLLHVDPLYISVVFSFSEFLFFSLLFLYFCKNYFVFRFSTQWLKKHLVFGMKGLWGGALIESNSRIDVLMIGYFMSDKSVGIYSFAAMIAEGFAQLYAVLKNNVDPYFGKTNSTTYRLEIGNLIKRIRRKYIPIIFIIGIGVILTYPMIFGMMFSIEKEYIEKSWEVLIILMIFIAGSSFFKPFAGLLTQIGKPELFSLIVLSSVMFNIILNFLLIPLFGLNGAAFSTGVTFFMECTLIYFLSRRIIQIKYKITKPKSDCKYSQ
jgi:O-antigen/teichoic acid export membrane protein